MIHRRQRPHRQLPSAVSAIVAVAALAACSPAPTASFDPAAACTVDGRMTGAYPELEARIPTTFEGRGPDRLDSGRHCTAAGLGSLAAAGFDEVRFAGGTWDLGSYRAAALVVFAAPGLTADHIAEFYEASARAANRTQVTDESRSEIAGRTSHRLDSTTGDRTQTVVTWPAADEGVVNVVLTNDLPDPKIQAAIDAFGGG